MINVITDRLPISKCQALLVRDAFRKSFRSSAGGKPISCTLSPSSAVIHEITPVGKEFHFVVDGGSLNGKAKVRLDAFLAAQLNDASSRAQVQAGIREGRVHVNGARVLKAAGGLRLGDSVVCSLPPPKPMEAVPEDIPLDITYEDDDLIVVNKPVGMVVHISPGHDRGTLVNALLHHCGLPAIRLDPSQSPPQALMGGQGPAGLKLSDDHEALPKDLSGVIGGEDEDEDELEGESTSATDASHQSAFPGISRSGGPAVIRPGIVHRIDKGTSGLLVVAKTEYALRHLTAQFKARTVRRLYQSITLGSPTNTAGRIEANVGRDPGDRKRMAAFPYGSNRGRLAASNYEVAEVLARGGAAHVLWRLDTGRTHQIRVHAKHIGHPLLGDETYGGTSSSGVASLARCASVRPSDVKELVSELARPALHAQTLGFKHPTSGVLMEFECTLPDDFIYTLKKLREWN